MAQNLSQMNNAALVDALGELKAEQAKLAKREKELKKALTERMARSNTNKLFGDMFDVVRVSSMRTTLDADAVKALLANPPMKTSMVRSFRVHGRVCEAA